MICPEDDVLDYMVMEAVSIKAAMEDKKRQEEEKAEAERKEYKSDFSELERYR